MPEPLPQPSPGPNINFVHHQTKKPKWKIIAMIVIIILGLANLGAYVYRLYVYNGIVKFINSQPSHTPRPTPSIQSSQFEAPSDWQTYRNEEYGFEFKYPEDWNIFANNPHYALISSERSDSDEFRKQIAIEEYKIYLSRICSINIEINTGVNTRDKDLIAYLKELDASDPYPDSSLESILLGQKSAVFLEESDPMEKTVFYKFSDSEIIGLK